MHRLLGPGAGTVSGNLKTKKVRLSRLSLTDFLASFYRHSFDATPEGQTFQM